MVKAAPRDPRWVFLGESGEYVILGRHREPDAGAIASAEAALAEAGRSGWIAIMSRSAHSHATPEFLMVSPFRDPQGSFEDAVHAFLARHCF